MFDEQIINKCILGDRSAQERLYSYFAPRTYGICLRYCSSSFEADDILQEAFIKIFNRLKSFTWEGSFEGWIKRIVVNTAIDHYHLNIKKNNHVHLELVDETQTDINSFTMDMNEEDLVMILSRLPLGYRMVFNLYAIEGYSHKEIAEMLDISEGTSKSQLSRARKFLQSLLHLTKIN